MKNKDMQQDAPAKAKKKSLYYIIIAACALVLAAAITFTVVMVTQDSSVSLEKPEDPDDGKVPETPDGDDDDDDDDEPTSGEMVFSLPVENGTVATTFSFWYNQTLNRYNLHQGIDFQAEAGTNVTAAYDGTVSSITDTLLEGGCVIIDHGNGLQTVYASIDAAQLKVGDSVTKGDVIGTVSAAADVMGNEYNEGSHLHFEVRENGKAVDPASYLDLDEK